MIRNMGKLESHLALIYFLNHLRNFSRSGQNISDENYIISQPLILNHIIATFAQNMDLKNMNNDINFKSFYLI